MELILNLRKASIEDSESISKLVNSVYRGANSRFGWTTEADLLGGQRTDVEKIQEILLDPYKTILIFQNQAHKNQIVACVLLERQEKSAYLGMLSVDVNFQNLGLGRRLINAAKDFIVTEWQLGAIKITVIAQRLELIQWYQRCGFIKTGDKESFPLNDPRFGIPKRKDLYFEVLSLKV